MPVYPVAGILGPDGAPTCGPTTITIADGMIAGLSPDTRGGPASPLVAMPPLVNSHDHGRGLGLTSVGITDGPLEAWIDRLSADRRQQRELVGQAARLLLAKGVGAAVFCVNPSGPDLETEIEEACAAACSAGIRAAVAVPFADTGGRMRGRADRTDNAELADYLELFARLSARHFGVDLQLGPVGPQWVTEGALSMLAEFAVANGVRMHMHLLESPAQRAWADELYPEGVVTWLDELGVLGPHMWFAHGTQLRTEEMALLAARGCGLAVNASSNLRLCSGFAPVGTARREGIDLAMGLDGLSLNEDSDPWTELRLLRGLAQAQLQERVCAAEVLALGFNAAALGTRQPEPIAEGRPADLLVVDIGDRVQLLGHPDWSPADIVLAAPVSVHALWVAGTAVHQTEEVRQPVPLSTGGLP
ncbi:amidohydrolase family protein [soil metagenome]